MEEKRRVEIKKKEVSGDEVERRVIIIVSRKTRQISELLKLVREVSVKPEIDEFDQVIQAGKMPTGIILKKTLRALGGSKVDVQAVSVASTAVSVAVDNCDLSRTYEVLNREFGFSV